MAAPGNGGGFFLTVTFDGRWTLMDDLASMSEIELIAARDKAHSAANEKLEWTEFARRTKEWLRYRDECDRRGIPRRPH